MDFVLYALGQLGLLVLAVIGLVALFFAAIFLFVRKKHLPESMRSDEER